MEFETIRNSFDRGKRLLIGDINDVGGKIIDVVNYFTGLPKGWSVHYFDDGAQLREAIKTGCISGSAVLVLPTDAHLDVGQVYKLAATAQVRVLVIVGRKRDHEHIPDRDRMFYIYS